MDVDALRTANAVLVELLTAGDALLFSLNLFLSPIFSTKP
jgi:hypothetical protein